VSPVIIEKRCFKRHIRKMDKFGSRRVVHLESPLVAFMEGRSEASLKECANKILDHCTKNCKYESKTKSFLLDDSLRTLFKHRSRVSKFPGKIIEELQKARMVTYWSHS